MKKLYLALAVLLLVITPTVAATCSTYSTTIAGGYCEDVFVKNPDLSYQANNETGILFTIDHAALVSAGKSLASGYDVWFGYQGKIVPFFNITPWNTAATQVVVRAQYAQAAGNNDTVNYSVYTDPLRTTTNKDYISTYLNVSRAAAILGDDFNYTTWNATGQWAQQNAPVFVKGIDPGTFNLQSGGALNSIWAFNPGSTIAGSNKTLLFRIRDEPGYVAGQRLVISGVCSLSDAPTCGSISHPVYIINPIPPNKYYYGDDIAPVLDFTPAYQFYTLKIHLGPVANTQFFYRDLTTNPGNATVATGAWLPLWGNDGTGWFFNLTLDSVLAFEDSARVPPVVNFGPLETMASSYVSTQFTTPVYELTNQTYRLYINGSALTNVGTIEAYLTWNNTNIVNYSTSATTDKNYTFTFYNIPGVLQNNGTNAALNFTYQITFVNLTVGTNVTTTTETQNIAFGYLYSNFTLAPTQVSEGATVTGSGNITNSSGGIGESLTVVHNWNATNSAATLVSGFWNATWTAPLLGNLTSNITGWSTFNLSYGGFWRFVNSSQTFSIVNQINISNCSSSTNYLVNFTFYDEETLAAMYANLGITINASTTNGVLSRTFNFTFTNVTVAPICITPAGSYYVNSVLDFWSNNATTYPHRNWYHLNASLSTISPTFTNLYLESTASGAILTQFLLTSQSGLPVEGYTIQATRYYPTLNQYLLVAMLQTGSAGTGSTYLKPNAAIEYRFFAYNDTSLVENFTPQTVPCDPAATTCSVALQLTGTVLESYFTKVLDVSLSCANTTVLGTTYETCTYSDPSGTLSSARLQVYEVGSWANSIVCDTTSTSTAGAITCNLGNATNREFNWYFFVGFSPPLLAGSGALSYTGATNQYGSSGIGLVIAALGVIGVGFIGLTSPGLAVILSAAFVLVGQLSHLIFLSWAGLTAFLLVAVIAAFSTKT